MAEEVILNVAKNGKDVFNRHVGEVAPERSDEEPYDQVVRLKSEERSKRIHKKLSF